MLAIEDTASLQLAKYASTVIEAKALSHPAA